MPKKRNFLGGMQNYDPANGQYEPNLTTASGEQATPENVPGGGENKGFQAFKKRTDNEDINVSNKRKHDSIKLLEDRYNEIKNKWVDAEIEDDEFVSQLKKFKNELDSVDKNSVYDTELESLTKTIDSYISRLNKNTTNNSFDDINKKRMGTTEHKLDISNKLKTVRNKEFGFKHYDLSEDILTEVYNYFSGDEDEMLDYLRNYDFGMTSGDLQGVIEVFRPKNK